MKRICCVVSIAAGSPISIALPASAADDTLPAVKPVHHFEAWAGVDGAARAWSVYTGTTVALGGDIREDGWRLRGGGGYGAYTYTSPRWDGKHKQSVTFDGKQSSADILAGYQFSTGPLTVKAFAGATQERHLLTPFDIENSVQGVRWGAKLALETWLNLDRWGFIQLEASWSSSFNAHSIRVRGGYRLAPSLSLGLESGIVGNDNYEAGRAGVFGRFEWSRGEVSVSGGVSGDRSGDTGAYGSVGVLVRF